jgi:C1A family cysteine protease
MHKRFSLLPFVLAAIAGCGQSGAPSALPMAQAHHVSALADTQLHGMGAHYEGTLPVAGDGATGKAESADDFEAASAPIPERVDLRDGCSPIVNQGHSNTCVSVTTAKGLGEFLLKKQHRYQPLSALFIYYQARKLGHLQYPDLIGVDRDNGSFVGDALKALDNLGVPPEADMPFFDSSASKEMVLGFVTKAPEAAAADHAKSFRLIKGYKPITALSGIRRSLANGLPVPMSMLTYASLHGEVGPGKNVVTVPDFAKDKFTGGHAVLAVGYDQKRRVLIVRNSWGTKWGDQGYFYLSYDYFRAKDPIVDEDGQPLVFDAYAVKL